MTNEVHNELVRLAFSWLKNKKNCSIVVSELTSGSNEIPDAIGWRGGWSILVEAKASLSDFKADAKKTFRIFPNRGMGYHRYYIIPAELEADVMPLMPSGWGLLVFNGKRVIERRASGDFMERDQNSEMLFMSSIIRRIAARPEPIKGVAVRCYVIDTPYDARAELFIEPEFILEQS